MTARPTRLSQIGAFLVWPGLLAAVAAGVYHALAGDGRWGPWLAVGWLAFGGATTLWLGRNAPYARSLESYARIGDHTASNWDEPYESDYHRATGVYPGPLVFAIFWFLAAALGVAWILFP